MAEKTKTSEIKKEAEKNSDEMVEVYIPLDHSNEKSDKFYCSVNGVAMLIPMGKKVEVPAAYAYVIKNAQSELELIRSKNRDN